MLRSRLDALKNLGGTLTVSTGNSGPSHASVQINVQASNDQVLHQAAQQVKDALSHMPGLADVTSNLTDATPVLDVIVNPQLALNKV